MKNRWARAGLLGIFAAGALALPGATAPLARKDRKYLAGIYRDTWAFLAQGASEKTGLPYDSSRRTPNTSTTNAGLYLAACAVAGRTGLIPREEALARIGKGLEALAKTERFLGGFPVTWFDADTLATTDKQFSTVDHLSNLTAGLLAVKGLYPELAASVDKVLTPMDWGRLYDPAAGFYKGGWRMDKGDFDVQQAGWEWHYSYLGADTRFGSFWGVATRQVPPESWLALNRGREEKYNFSYLLPGWQGGGLFMQTLTGIFLDERATEIGKSAADFAWAQMHHASRIGAPVWGWSACESPNGKSYLGWGAITDAVVTPHAAGLAAVYYPAQAAANFRALEKRGARAPCREGKNKFRWGFRDSMNWRTGAVSEHYLCLDQAMLFLSLANLLHDGVLWKAVATDPHVSGALRDIPEYRLTYLRG